MKRKIVIIGINYYPEDTAIGLYTSQLSEYLKKDKDITIITGFPYYPAWKINEEYRSKKKFLEETKDGIRILRYKQYVPSKPTFLKRVLHLLDFTFGTFINSFKIKKADVVICIVPFIGSIGIAKFLARRKKAKLWIHVQDFEFDAAIDSNLKGKRKSSFIDRLLYKIEKNLLSKGDLISTISTSMLSKLDKKLSNKTPPKTKLLPNWIDDTLINPNKSSFHKNFTKGKFSILYSGNIGEKQDWNYFISFAKELKQHDDIEIIIVGDGSRKKWLIEKTKELKKIKYFNPVPYSELSDLLCSASLHILFQKNDVVDTVMPSKILGMMASKKPSLITGNLKSEVNSTIEESKAGMYFENKDINKAINFVLTIKEDEDLYDYYSNHSRDYVLKKFSKESILTKFNNTFNELLS